MSSRYERKRKQELDKDTTEGAHDSAKGKEHSSSSSSKRSRQQTRRSERDSSSPEESSGKGGNRKEDSLSIKETNELRAKLGLAPLIMDNEPPPKPLPGDEQEAEANLPKLAEGEELFTEDGVSIVHKPSENWSSKKESEKVREKLETQKQKRQIQSRVLKVTKGLAESDSEDDEAARWVEKSRQLEEQRKKADEKARLLDEMDEAFGVGGLIDEERKRISRPAARKRLADNEALTAGLVVGHSKEVFVDGKETVLVLQDKGVLDDNDDEVLINPNLLENERHKRNIDLRKKKSNYQPYEDEELDAYGQPSKQKILSKYDEGADGEEKERETFRLDNTGGYDVDKEAQQEEIKRKLMMANKKFESLQSSGPALAREFYTDEEMISFRRPSKKGPSKVRKRKMLKAKDLAPEMEEDLETQQEKEIRAAKLAARRRGGGESQGGFKAPIAPVDPNKALEEGELDEEPKADKTKHENGAPKGKEDWKSATGASVDVNKLKKFAETKGRGKSTANNGGDESHDDDEEESSDDDMAGGMDLAGVVLDDDAEDELGAALERARKLRQAAAKPSAGGGTGAEQVRAMLLSSSAIKREIKREDEMEVDDAQNGDSEEEPDESHIVFDATSEQYKSIGEIPTFGLAGNRRDGLDFSSMNAEQAEVATTKKGTSKDASKHQESDESGEEAVAKKEKSRKKSKKSSKKHSGGRSSWKEDKAVAGSSAKAGSSRHKAHSSKEKHRSGDEDDAEGEDGYENVLGEEEDVTKGVGAMLKLAGVKGYLEAGNTKNAGDGKWKQMLESKRFSKVEQGKYDIEDKTMRKLERMGTTGTGPIRPFADKADYTPAIEISYSDNKGRVMGSKEAFRALSWKFHGKGPGKKQIEKHQAKLEKREKLKMMNSSDTPLHTLHKQRNKQEQLGTPYLILSGTGRDTGTSLQKD